MKAVILAAGEGVRLRPFTETMPKVMLPVANKPILEYVVDAVNRSGIEELIMVVGYKKEVIMDYFRDHHNITYVVQNKQLGTAHALLQAKQHINEELIVLAGDNIIDDNSIGMLTKDNSNFSILIKEHMSPSKYGVVFQEGGKLKKIIEKPLEESGRFISTGIYKFPTTIFDETEAVTSQGVYALTSVVQSLLNKGREIHTIIADQWMDVVYPWDLLNVNETILNNSLTSLEGNIEKNVTIKGLVSIGRNTTIYSGCYIHGPVVIDGECEIGPNACIFPSTTIGKNVIVHPFSEIRNSIIMDGVQIGSNSYISHSIIGKGNKIGPNFSTVSGKSTVEIEDEYKKLETIGAMVGEDCNIESHVIIEPGRIIGRRCWVNSLKKVEKDLPSGSKVM